MARLSALMLSVWLRCSSLALGAEEAAAGGEEPREQPPPRFRPEDLGCQNFPLDWTDDLGRGCSEYGLNGTVTCPIDVSSEMSNGTSNGTSEEEEELSDAVNTAKTACCACGGGSSPLLKDGTRIYGGEVVTEAIPNFAAQMYYKADRNEWWGRGCGAVLVGARHLLSAAHCNPTPSHRGMGVSINTVNIYKTNNGGFPFEFIKLSKMEHHPSFSNSGSVKRADFSLFTLQRAASSAFASKRAILADADFTQELVRQGAWVTACGTGATDEGLDYWDVDLSCVDLPLIPWETCKAWRSGKISESMLCAGGLPNKDSCQGDSGGPLYFIDKRGNYILIGIVSWGEMCGYANNYGVYANVSWAFDWIKNRIPDVRTTKSMRMKVDLSHQLGDRPPTDEAQKMLNAHNEIRCRYNFPEVAWSATLARAADLDLGRKGAFDANGNYVYPAGSAGSQIAFKISAGKTHRDVVFEVHDKGMESAMKIREINADAGVRPPTNQVSAKVWNYLVSGDTEGKWRPAADVIAMIRSGFTRMGCARWPRLFSLTGRSGTLGSEDEEDEEQVEEPEARKKEKLGKSRNDRNRQSKDKSSDDRATTEEPTWLCMLEPAQASSVGKEVTRSQTSKFAECENKYAGSNAVGSTAGRSQDMPDGLIARASPIAVSVGASGAMAFAAALSALSALAFQ